MIYSKAMSISILLCLLVIFSSASIGISPEICTNRESYLQFIRKNCSIESLQWKNFTYKCYLPDNCTFKLSKTFEIDGQCYEKYHHHKVICSDQLDTNLTYRNNCKNATFPGKPENSSSCKVNIEKNVYLHIIKHNCSFQSEGSKPNPHIYKCKDKNCNYGLSKITRFVDGKCYSNFEIYPLGTNSCFQKIQNILQKYAKPKDHPCDENEVHSNEKKRRDVYLTIINDICNVTKLERNLVAYRCRIPPNCTFSLLETTFMSNGTCYKRYQRRDINCAQDDINKNELTVGSDEYLCSKNDTFIPEEQEKDIKSSPLFNKTVEEGIYELKKSLKNISVTNRQEITNFVRNCSVVLFKTTETNKDGGRVVELLESLGNAISDQLGEPKKEPKVGYQVSSFSTAFSVWNVKLKHFEGEGYTFPELSNSSENSYGLGSQTISLPKEIFHYTDNNKSYSSIISISYPPLKNMKDNAMKKETTIGSSNIISTSIKPRLSKTLQKGKGVRIRFNIASNKLQLECVFWNYTLDSWSNDGCYLVHSNFTHVECECNHLTDFSILMSVRETPSLSKEHRVALHYITLVGCIISIIFMALMIFIIVLIKKLRKNHRYLIHLNLAMALMIANIAMLLTDIAMKSEDSCLSLSILMFYFYLAALFWMLCEGVFIWRAFVTVFTENERFWKYLLLGWGLPMIVVVLTAGIRQRNLMSDNSCWLSVKNHSIYAFVVPAIVIILVDAIVLVVTLRITYRQSKKTNNEELKTMARATLILLPLLGVTWLFGVFAVNEDTLVFKYVFTVLNSFQGFFLFVCYILLSKEVQKHIRTIYRTNCKWSKVFNNNELSSSQRSQSERVTTTTVSSM